MLIEKLKNVFYLFQLVAFTLLVLLLVMYFDDRQNITLVLYKLSLAASAAVLGVWIDKLSFPGKGIDNLRRAIIIGACIVGVCMGL